MNFIYPYLPTQFSIFIIFQTEQNTSDVSNRQTSTLAYNRKPIGVTVTRTSRAWSFPDYDDFIIFEYELENTGNRLAATASYDTLYEMTVAFGYSHCPTNVAYLRQYGQWDIGDMKWEDLYGRFDLKR